MGHAVKVLAILVALVCEAAASMNLCTTCECNHRLGTVTCRNALDRFEDISYEGWVDHIKLEYCPTSPALLKGVFRRATLETTCVSGLAMGDRSESYIKFVYQHIHIRPPSTHTSSPPAQYSSTESCSTTIEPATQPRPSSTRQPLRYTVVEQFSTSLKTTTATPSKQPHSTSSPLYTTAMKLFSTGGGLTTVGARSTRPRQSPTLQAYTPHTKPTTPRYMRTTTRRYMRTTTRKPPRRQTARRRLHTTSRRPKTQATRYMRTTTRRYMRTTTRKPPRRQTTRRPLRTTSRRPKTQATTRRQRLSKPKRPTSTHTSTTTTTTTNAEQTLGEINETRHVNDRKHRAHSESDLQLPQSPQNIEVPYEDGSLIYWLFVAVGIVLLLSAVGNIVLGCVLRARRLNTPPVIQLQAPDPDLMGFDTPSHAAASGVSGDPNV